MDESELLNKVQTMSRSSVNTGGLLGTLVSERYEVLSEIGSGGMSTVYKVRQVHLNKILALKVLHDASELALQRFLLEAQASTMLQHPNIVTVHDFGIHNDRAFMVLDYIEGISLEDIITASPLDPARAIKIFLQICSALAHAHEHGVVHRDIKPSNILISKGVGDQECVIVLDFGIAKLMRPDDEQASQHLTRTGEVFGTPLYMSPEQCEGHNVDTRTDIYSLGCVMYETLTGDPPFEGYNYFNTIYKQLNEAPPPFSAELRKKKMATRLECVILKAMAKSPQNRHKFMLELSSELKEVELGTGGTVGDVMSSLRLVTGRLNAIERTRVLLGTSMQALTLLALTQAVLIFMIPPMVVISSAEAARNDAIIESVKMEIKKRFESGSIMKLDEGGFHRSMEVLRTLCRKDEQQARICEGLVANALRGYERAEQLPELFNQIFLSRDKAVAKEIRRTLNSAVKEWAHASKLSSDLLSVSYNNLAYQNTRLYIMLWLFEFCRWGGIVTELLLLVLLIRSYRNLRKDAAEKQFEQAKAPQ
jgi:serine/threonine protein kinase